MLFLLRRLAIAIVVASTYESVYVCLLPASSGPMMPALCRDRLMVGQTDLEGDACTQ